MKKVFSLLVTMILFVALTGCGKKETKTCTITEDNQKQIITVSATNNTVDEMEMTMIFESDFFGMDDLNALTNDQKEQIKTNMLKALGLEKSNYDGFSITIDITDVMTVVIDADLEVVDPDVIKKVGLDFTDTDMDFDRGIQSLIDNGAVCK